MSLNPDATSGGASSGSASAGSPGSSPAPLSRRSRREAERRGELVEAGDPREPGDPVVPGEPVHEIVDPVVAGLVTGTAPVDQPAAAPATTAPPAGSRASSNQNRSAPGKSGAGKSGPGKSAAGRTGQGVQNRAAGSDPGWLPLAVLVGVPVLVGLVLLVVVFELLRGLPDRPVVNILLLVLFCGVLGLLVAAARRLMTATEPTLVGAPMTERQEPRVWAAIKTVAAKSGAPAPANVVVDGSPMVALARTSGSRNMVIGLPLLLELEPEHFTALLARELALSTGGGLPAASRVSRLGERLDIVLGTQPGDRPADAIGRLLSHYRDLFVRMAAGSEQKVQERAEQLVAHLYGAQPVIDARQRLLVVQRAWEILVEEYLPLSETAQMRPQLAEGLQEILAHRRGALVSDATSAAAMTGPAENGMLDDPGTLGRIESAILLDEDPHGSWPEIAAAAGRYEVSRRAGGFAEQVVADPAEATLAGVLRALDRPDRTTPPGGFATPLTWLVQDALLTAGLAAFELNWTGPSRIKRRDPRGLWVDWDGDLAISAAAHSPAGTDQLRSWLFAAGVDLEHRYQPSTPEPSTPEPTTPELSTPEPAPLVVDLREPAPQVIDLREPRTAPDPRALQTAPAPQAPHLSPDAPQLSPVGQELEAAVGLADTRTDVTGISDVEVLGSYPVGIVDVLIFRDGLLLFGVSAPTLQDRTRSLMGRGPDALLRLAEAAEAAADLPGTGRKGWWIGFDEVASSSLRERRIGFELQLRMGDGSATTLRQRQASQLRGDPLADLRLLLPGD